MSNQLADSGRGWGGGEGGGGHLKKLIHGGECVGSLGGEYKEEKKTNYK